MTVRRWGRNLILGLTLWAAACTGQGKSTAVSDVADSGSRPPEDIRDMARPAGPDVTRTPDTVTSADMPAVSDELAAPPPTDVAVTPDESLPSDGQADATPPGDLQTPPPTALLMGPLLVWPEPDGLTVVWEADQPGPGRLEWGSASGQYPHHADTVGTAPDTHWKTYTFPATGGYLHTARIAGLSADTEFFYRVSAGPVVSPEYQTRTAPAPGTVPLRFVAFGDMRGNAEEHQKVVDDLFRQQGQVLIQTGDLAQIGGAIADWHKFFQIERDLLSGRATYPVVGNHEYAFGQPYYREFFRMPAVDYGEGFAYAVTFGPMRLIVLNAYASDLAAGPQYDWLVSELEAAQADPDISLRVVSLHTPLYTFSKHPPEMTLRAVLHPLFLATGVNLVLTGHNHCYEHFIVDGLDYVTTGGGGADLYDTDVNVIEQELALRVAATSSFHYVVIDHDGTATTLHVWAVPSGDLIETFTL